MRSSVGALWGSSRSALSNHLAAVSGASRAISDRLDLASPVKIWKDSSPLPKLEVRFT
jgi:hypothetical protein